MAAVGPRGVEVGVDRDVTRSRESESGVTLVEMMVAIMLLGLILSAAAAALINFTQATHTNERRVQATAVMTGLHEELQSIPWGDAALYEGEAAALEDVGVTSGTPRTFEDRELVTLEDVDEADRAETVPEAHFQLTVDDRDYEVFQIVTWDGSGGSEVKRFTTIVRWEVLGREIEERFDSERAASAGEAGDPTLPRVIQFQVGPSPMELVDLEVAEGDDPAPDRNSGDISIAVRFSEGVEAATLRYWAVHHNDRSIQQSQNVRMREFDVPLDGAIADPDNAGRYLFFTGTIDAHYQRFPDGPRPFRVEGELGGESFWGSTSMTFFGGSLDPRNDPAEGEEYGEEIEDGDDDPEDEGSGEYEPPEEDVMITSLDENRTHVCLDPQNRLRTKLEITATIQGLRPEDHFVSATYTAASSTVANLDPLNELFQPSGATFKLVFEAGADHGFKNGDKTAFNVVAQRPESDGRSDSALTSEISFVRDSGQAC